MSSTFDVYAISDRTVAPIPLTSLTPVGGTKSSGVALESLKSTGDYAILAPHASGVIIHPLRGSARHPQSIQSGQSCRIDDLTVIVVPHVTLPGTTRANPDLHSLQQVLCHMVEPQNTRKPLTQVLSAIMEINHHEKGLIISKGVAGEFEILVSNNVDAHESWISESLIQTVLQEKRPTFVQNVIGSTYHSSQSLIGTGFLSVFCWPLIVQGVPAGVLLTGSNRPHLGLSSADQQRVETFVHLAAMITNFRLRELSLRREIDQLRERGDAGPFQTQSLSLKSTCDLAQQVADSDLAVLIQGETGVGKEVMARWMHEHSSRRKGPFVAVNCGAIPSELLESLLFGHKKGSFTNAIADQMGKVQQAHGGTLFLDEIGDLPVALQPKLLRVLNDKCVEPLGSSRSIQVNVRLLAATHKTLKQLVAEKTFREDLYYRVAEMTLWIPPLRERSADILMIANQCLKEMDAEKSFRADASEWLMHQPWKGNVRELKSVIKRAVVLSTGQEIGKSHFTMGTEAERTPSPAGKEWLGAQSLEKAKHLFVMQKIQQALELTAGNRTHAAQLLGITPRTLFRYLEGDMKEVSQ